MGPAVRTFLVVILLLRAQLGVAMVCMCRYAGECGHNKSPGDASSRKAPEKIRKSCCGQRTGTPQSTPDEEPRPCSGCNRVESVSYMGTGGASDALLSGHGAFQPRDMAPMMLTCDAPPAIARATAAPLRGHGPPLCPSGESPDMLPVLRL